jgi:hypothetical protein
MKVQYVQKKHCAVKGRKRALRTLSVGQSFGELALQVAGGRRAATVSAEENCDLLTLNGFEYRSVLAEHHRHELDSRVRTMPPCSSPVCITDVRFVPLLVCSSLQQTYMLSLKCWLYVLHFPEQ